MAETTPTSTIKLVTVENTSYVALPFGKPEYFGLSKKFNFRIMWGDGEITNVKNNYNNDSLAWDRNYDKSGRPQNSAPQADVPVTICHKYANPGKYTITVYGGFGNNDGQTNNNNFRELRVCFAKSEDRLECRGTPEAIEEIIGFGSAHRGDLYVHGQGDFEDFKNLKKIECSLRLLTAANPESSLVFDNAAENAGERTGRVVFKNTFKNCEKLTPGTKNRIKFLMKKPLVISMESCFENCGYDGFLPWDTTNVTNFNKTCKNSKNLQPIPWKFNNAVSMDYTFQNSYVGRAYYIPVTVSKPDSSSGDDKWKFVLTNTENKVVWSHDNSQTVGEAFSQPPDGGAYAYNTEANGSTEGLVLGKPGGDMNPLDPDSILDNESDNDFKTLRLHTWHDNGSGFTKIANQNINLNTPGNVVKDQNLLFGDTLLKVVSMKGTFKDHKKFDANLLRLCFTGNNNYPLESLESCFEGVDFLKSRNGAGNASRYKLRIVKAKPISLKAYVRNSKNTFDIRFLDSSRLTDTSHLVQDTDYNQNPGYDMSKVTELSYMFAGCSGNPPIRAMFLKKGGDSRNFPNQNCEGMFEGSSNWTTDIPWKHIKPSSAKRMFRNCSSEFTGITLGDMSSCTSIESIFANAAFQGTGNIASWNLAACVNASYALLNNPGTWSLTRWFNVDQTYAIENVDGMFEGSANNSNLSGWNANFLKTVKSAQAMFKNSLNFTATNYSKLFRGSDSALEEISEIFMKVKKKTVSSDDSRFLKQWVIGHDPDICGAHINVLKNGISYGGPIGRKGCRYRNFETDDDVTSPPEYEEVNKYVNSSEEGITYDHICEKQIIDVRTETEYDTVFMAIY